MRCNTNCLFVITPLETSSVKEISLREKSLFLLENLALSLYCRNNQLQQEHSYSRHRIARSAQTL